jgi:two-component system chemotaxis sensor kinase CheA
MPDERIACGKPPDATLTLSAATAGEFVRIEIADDGRGIDAARIRERAAAQGFTVPSGTPDASALLSLLCFPGFSTRDDPDRVSGRGVGMAVVKAAVEELSGALTLETEPGAGTRFVIELPLTLSIADALIVRVGGDTFAVPQSAVREVIEVNEADVRVLEHGEIVSYRGGALSIVRLSHVFGIAARETERFHVFVIGHGPAAVGIVVDRIIGQREIVVRTIADPLVRAEGIAGATDLGDGAVVLILDPAAVVRHQRARHRGASLQEARA